MTGYSLESFGYNNYNKAEFDAIVDSAGGLIFADLDGDGKVDKNEIRTNPLGIGNENKNVLAGLKMLGIDSFNEVVGKDAKAFSKYLKDMRNLIKNATNFATYNCSLNYADSYRSSLDAAQKSADTLGLKDDAVSSSVKKRVKDVYEQKIEDYIRDSLSGEFKQYLWNSASGKFDLSPKSRLEAIKAIKDIGGKLLEKSDEEIDKDINDPKRWKKILEEKKNKEIGIA